MSDLDKKQKKTTEIVPPKPTIDTKAAKTELSGDLAADLVSGAPKSIENQNAQKTDAESQKTEGDTLPPFADTEWGDAHKQVLKMGEENPEWTESPLYKFWEYITKFMAVSTGFVYKHLPHLFIESLDKNDQLKSQELSSSDKIAVISAALNEAPQLEYDSKDNELNSAKAASVILGISEAESPQVLAARLKHSVSTTPEGSADLYTMVPLAHLQKKGMKRGTVIIVNSFDFNANKIMSTKKYGEAKDKTYQLAFVATGEGFLYRGYDPTTGKIEEYDLNNANSPINASLLRYVTAFEPTFLDNQAQYRGGIDGGVLSDTEISNYSEQFSSGLESIKFKTSTLENLVAAKNFEDLTTVGEFSKVLLELNSSLQDINKVYSLLNINTPPELKKALKNLLKQAFEYTQEILKKYRGKGAILDIKREELRAGGAENNNIESLIKAIEDMTHLAKELSLKANTFGGAL